MLYGAGGNTLGWHTATNLVQWVFLVACMAKVASSFFGFFERLSASAFMPKARTCIVVALGLLLLTSLLMVASASIPFASMKNMNELKFFWSQLGYMTIAIALAALLYRVPVKWYYDHSVVLSLFLLLIFLLTATLMFGQNINGSKRWLSLFGISFQPAEFAKTFMVIATAAFMHRRSAEIRHKSIVLSGARLLVWYAPVLALLVFQPDYGSVVVLAATLFVLLFVGGVRPLQLVMLGAVVGIIGAIGAWQQQYRQGRILSFSDPFADPLGAGYQLSRSLMAFGRGEWTGVGYGNSVQKLLHLPEAHTDFLLAVTGEELGLFGVAFVILLEFIIIGAMLRISYKALLRRQLKFSYTVFGFAVIIFGQVCINAGMNMGILPTKGLTLPFYSYGGSSMLFAILMIAMTLRIDEQSPIIARSGTNREY